MKRTLEQLLELRADTEARIAGAKKDDEPHPDEQLYEMFLKEGFEETLRLIDEKITSWRITNTPKI